MYKIKIKISNKNVSYYREKLKNYYLKSGEEIEIPINYLPVGSKMKVEVNCTECNKLKSVIYRNYIKHDNYICNKCKYSRIKSTNLKKYGIENTFQLENYSRVKSEECKQKISKKSKESYKSNFNFKESDKNYKKMSKTKNKKHSKLFSEKANKVHHNFYDYSKVEYINCTTKVTIICPVHGEFEQKPQDHINSKNGCPSCKESKGEKEIRYYLEFNDIEYIYQKKFDGCKYKSCLPFDFYLPKYNICIEFDGEQHFIVVEAWGGENGLQERKKKDKIKTNFCLNNGIKLIRIKYDEDVENKLKQCLKN